MEAETQIQNKPPSGRNGLKPTLAQEYAVMGRALQDACFAHRESAGAAHRPSLASSEGGSLSPI